MEEEPKERKEEMKKGTEEEMEGELSGIEIQVGGKTIKLTIPEVRELRKQLNGLSASYRLFGFCRAQQGRPCLLLQLIYKGVDL